jgi:hypothetical protein
MHVIAAIAAIISPWAMFALLASPCLQSQASPLPSSTVPILEKRQSEGPLQGGAVVSSNDYIASHSLSLMNSEGDRVSAVSKRAELEEVDLAQVHGIQTIADFKTRH